MDAAPMEASYVSHVVTRTGKRVPVRFDEITDRNLGLCSGAYGRSLGYVENLLPAITQGVVRRFKNGMTTHDLDMLTAAVCAAQSTRHQDYSDLAARIIVSDLQKRTATSFVETVRRLDAAVNAAGRNISRLHPEFVGIAERAAAEIDRRIDCARDFRFTYFGIQTMLRSYLLREAGQDTATVERPQHAYMRVALALCVGQPDRGGHQAPEDLFRERLERAFEVYDLLSTQRLTHASPTMFNAGTKHSQLSSCYLLGVDDDLNVLLQVDKDAASISKWAGGIGICLTPMRAKGAPIKSTGGKSSGLPHYIAKLNSGQLYVNQGGLRPGAYALYLETWHADIFTFLEMGRFNGVAVNAPDLKYALWVNDMFMEAVVEELRVKGALARGEPVDEKAAAAAGNWYLFSPDRAPGLDQVYGDEFRALYRRYVEEKRYERVVKTSAVMTEWFKTVAQKGNPYILFKDHINRKSNLSHYRTITNSNLCAEITIPCFHEEGKEDEAEYGTCNLGAIPLASFVVPDARADNPGRVRVDWQALITAAGVAVRNLDNVIDINFYPVEACRRSNMKHRPVALGVMGLADVLAKFRYAYGSPEARALDRALHAAVYYGAMAASSRLGEERGNFASFEGSAAQRGLIQPDLWVQCGHLDGSWEAEVAGTTGGALAPEDWAGLRARCSKFLRNSYVTADMPTATSSQATGQNECFEPFTSNLYTRKTLAGEFTLLNPHLLAELEALGLWDEEMRRALIASAGSVQGIARVPADLRRRYRTARELDQRLLTLHAKARNPFLSQSQSLNYYLGSPDLSGILTVLVLGWQQGLTTGCYYVHTQPAVGSAKTSVASIAPPDEDDDGGRRGTKCSAPAGVERTEDGRRGTKCSAPAGVERTEDDCTVCSV
jgi:ribonucleoside-diphosphate reductase alpha subunit